MVLQKAFIPLSQQEVNSCIRISQPELFNQWRSEDYVSDECGLDDEEFQNCCKL